MKALLLATLFMSGGSAVALQNEEVQGTVEGVANQISCRVGNMFKGGRVENVKENGFAFPSDEYLSTLTEEQAFAVTSAVDVINANHDWVNMTDEEIIVALQDAHTTLQELYTDLGISGPATQVRLRPGQSGENGNKRARGNGRNENFVPNGDGVQDGTCLDDEEVLTPDDSV